MPLSTGTRLGPYEIVTQLGAGGMGEVYRANDTRLDRAVAIKILPSHLSSNADSKQRFEREARAISKLSHPHICGLFDVGSQDGTEFLVMELLEGETLAQRLSKGPLPLDQMLRFAIQIADALDKAHRQGIIHRDLKPANIMLTKSGVKLLDFGLAKLQSAPSSPNLPEVSLLATEARDITNAGTVLGTVQYMAPEQLEGKEADARTDIFAFGSVVFEMATGKKAFEGKSQASLISAILKDEPPPISKIQPLAPAALDRVVKTCLAKDPDERWQNLHDVMKELIWITDGTSTASVSASLAPRRNWERIFWIFTVFALGVALVSTLRYARKDGKTERPMRYSIFLPEKSAVRSAVLSPDGSKFVIVARDSSGENLLWIRSVDSLNIRAIPNTLNPSYPFWSPDSRFIGFFADGKLKKINTDGGPAQTLCDAPIPRGGTWSRKGIILFNPTVTGVLYQVSDSGGIPKQLTQKDPQRGEDNHRWPWFLPDGEHFLYSVGNFQTLERSGIYVRSFVSKQEKLLVKTASNIAFASGYLFFRRDRNLFAQKFDENNLELKGDPLLVVQDIGYFPQTTESLFSVSENGVLLYQSHSPAGISQLVWVDRTGAEISKLGTPANQSNPRVSPDGKKVALDIIDPQTGNGDVWIYLSSGGIPTRFTNDPSQDSQPNWSPDGERIVFTSVRSTHRDLYWKNSNGTGKEEVVLKAATNKMSNDWSPDGKSILYRQNDSTKISNLELWALPLQTGKPFPYIQSTFGVSHGQFSPDGRFAAYASNETGTWEIYVTSFPTSGTNWKISTAGGTQPRWKRDGTELFFLAPDGKIMSVDVRTGPTFEADLAKPLFQTRMRQHISSTDCYNYDVSPDGQRFLINKDVGEVTAPSLTIVLNWPAELQD